MLGQFMEEPRRRVERFEEESVEGSALELFTLGWRTREPARKNPVNESATSRLGPEAWMQSMGKPFYRIRGGTAPNCANQRRRASAWNGSHFRAISNSARAAGISPARTSAWTSRSRISTSWALRRIEARHASTAAL